MPLFSFQPKSHMRKKDYDIGTTLGRGGYGEVKLATRVDGQLFAVKVVQKAVVVDMPSQIQRQAMLLDFHHPHVIKLHEWFESKERLYLVFELAAGGELYERLLSAERFKEAEARDVAQALNSAIAYLHGKLIVHRDIKLENVLYRSTSYSDCCISDFGLATQLDTADQKLHNHCGSAGYTAPEVYGPDGYGMPVDMWSLGVVVFCLMGGRFPYKQTEPRKLAIEASTTKLYFPKTWDSISQKAKDFIQRLLTVDPALRMTAAEALQHPWLTTPIEPPTPRAETPEPTADNQRITRRPTKLPVVTNGTGTTLELRPTVVEPNQTIAPL